MAVNPSVMSPAMKDIAVTVHKAADDARDVAAETTHDLRERLAELRDEVAQHAAKQQVPLKKTRKARKAGKAAKTARAAKAHKQQSHRGRTFMLLAITAIGIAAVVMYVKRRQEAADYGPSSDAFGAAVVEQQRATSDGEPVVTPGA